MRDFAIDVFAAKQIRKDKTSGYIFDFKVKGIKCYNCGFLNSDYRSEDYTQLDVDRITGQICYMYFCPKCNIRFIIPYSLKYAAKDVIIYDQ